MTVVIPTRNRWSGLFRRGLRAALIQRDIDVGVVVVDDGSDRLAPAHELLDDRRVSLIRHQRPLGVAAARNTGLEHASGSEWVAFLDDDDLWAPHRLKALVSALSASHADFGYSSVLIVDEELRPVQLIGAVPPDELPGEALRTNGVHAAGSNIVVRRPLIERLGGFDTAFSTAADWDLVIRLATAARPGAVDEALLVYHASGWRLRDEAAHRADLERLEAKHPELQVDWSAFERSAALGFHRAGRRLAAARRYLQAAARYRQPKSVALAATTIIARRPIDRRRHARALARPSWLSHYVTP